MFYLIHFILMCYTWHLIAICMNIVLYLYDCVSTSMYNGIYMYKCTNTKSSYSMYTCVFIYKLARIYSCVLVVHILSICIDVFMYMCIYMWIFTYISLYVFQATFLILLIFWCLFYRWITSHLLPLGFYLCFSTMCRGWKQLYVLMYCTSTFETLYSLFELSMRLSTFTPQHFNGNVGFFCSFLTDKVSYFAIYTMTYKSIHHLIKYEVKQANSFECRNCDIATRF